MVRFSSLVAIVLFMVSCSQPTLLDKTAFLHRFRTFMFQTEMAADTLSLAGWEHSDIVLNGLKQESVHLAYICTKDEQLEISKSVSEYKTRALICRGKLHGQEIIEQGAGLLDGIKKSFP